MARIERAASDFEERLVQVNRVSKVVKGGRRFSFSSVVVVGDGRGTVGAGTGKAAEVPESIRKAGEDARKHMIRVPLIGNTIPHEVVVSYGASKVLLKPAAPGTGVIAGGGVRAVVEAAGIKDILTKSLGNNNPINAVRATLLALSQLHSIENEAMRRGMPQDEIERRHFRKDVAVQKALREGHLQQNASTQPASKDHQIVGQAPGIDDRSSRGGGRGGRRDGGRGGGGGGRGRG
jgi:small subunit ribosomal protein S5